MDIPNNTHFYRDLLDHIGDGVYFVDPRRGISFWNKGAERLTGYSSEDMVGRCCADGLLMHVDNDGHALCLTGCPLQATLMDGAVREAEVFLHHKNGYRVPVRVRVEPVRDTDGVIIGAVEVFADNTRHIEARHRIQELEEFALIDALTGIGNRRFAEMHLESQLNELERYKMGFGLLFMDIDHFKVINDVHGHDVGDEALKMVTQTLEHTSRASDIVGRWGGEEFVVICQNVGLHQLGDLAERYRILVEHSQLSVDSGVLRATVSIGGTVARAGDAPDVLVKRADALMYESKQCGRNRVTIEASLESAAS